MRTRCGPAGANGDNVGSRAAQRQASSAPPLLSAAGSAAAGRRALAGGPREPLAHPTAVGGSLDGKALDGPAPLRVDRRDLLRRRARVSQIASSPNLSLGGSSGTFMRASISGGVRVHDHDGVRRACSHPQLSLYRLVGDPAGRAVDPTGPAGRVAAGPVQLHYIILLAHEDTGIGRGGAAGSEPRPRPPSPSPTLPSSSRRLTVPSPPFTTHTAPRATTKAWGRARTGTVANGSPVPRLHPRDAVAAGVRDPHGAEALG